jgi:hypothetical protein
MRRRQATAACILFAACLFALPGCSVWEMESADLEDDQILAADDVDEVQAAPGIPQKLELQLKPGDRFPLLKTVEHTLRQPSEGGWSISTSSLEMLLSITVQEIRPPVGRGSRFDDPRAGEKRLEVQYHRIRFSQQLPGNDCLEYDSDSPVLPIPLAAVGYHGLKDNRFEFWLNQDNQIVEIVAFDQFLDRCLRDVPTERQEQVRAALAATSGADGIANFVDDSIGLLPNSTVREGDSWTRDRQILQPVPMHCSTRYVLRRITDDVAEIDIAGTLSSLITSLENPIQLDVEVSIRGGQAMGACTLDRRTGLPLNSRVDQSLDMLVKLSDGTEFEQHKTTVTTVRHVPDLGGRQAIPSTPPPSSAGTSAGDVVQTGAEAAAPADERPLPFRDARKPRGAFSSRR